MGSIKDEALAVAAEAADGDDEAREASRNLIDAFQRWETTREYALKERKRCNENVKVKLAALKEAMEVGHQTEADQLLKLGVVEGRWQDLEDSRAERKELLSSMRDQLKLAENRIRELIADLKSPQLDLFGGSSSTIDSPPPPEAEDEEEEEVDEDSDAELE